MTRWFSKLYYVWKLRNDPVAELYADYETLVRLARRCAYDFSHAADFTPRPEDHWLGMDWGKRADSWVGLFAKGNPGKDYRLKYTTQLNTTTHDAERLIGILKENGLEEKIPVEFYDRYDCLKPF